MMKCTRAVAQALGTLPTIRATLPELANVLVTEEDGQLFVQSTDLQVHVRIALGPSNAGAGTAVQVDNRTLRSVVNAAAAAGGFEIGFGSPTEDAMASAAKSARGWGKSTPNISVFSVREDGERYGTIVIPDATPAARVASKEYPTVTQDGFEEVGTINRKVLQSALRLAVQVSATDDSRAALQSVNVKVIDSQLVFEATNGFCLVQITQKGGYDLNAARTGLWSRRCVMQLLAMLSLAKELQADNVTVSVDPENMVRFECGAWRLVGQTISASFPNTSSILSIAFRPADDETVCTVFAQHLWRALKLSRSAYVSRGEKTGCLLRNPKGGEENYLSVYSSSHTGFTSFNVPCAYTAQGADNDSLYFDIMYLLNIMPYIDAERVEIHWKKREGPFAIDASTASADIKIVVMPLHWNG